MSEISEQTEQRQLTNRRLYYRLQMRSVCYVEMGDGNGGVMLNLSEGGFTLQAAEVLAENRFPQMRFRLPKSERWVEASGKMVWHGKSRKEAGIEFVDLSDEARQLIRDWMFAQTFADEDSAPDRERRRRGWESEKALADTASIPKPRTVSSGAAGEWTSFFPNESELPEKDPAVSKVASHAEAFSPEESTLALSPVADKSAPAAQVSQEVPVPSLPAADAEASAPVAVVATAPPAPVIAKAQASTVAMQPEFPIPAKPAEQVQPPGTTVAGRESSDAPKGVQDRVVANPPVPRASRRILFDQALAGSLASRTNYLSAYSEEPAKSSGNSWFLTATVAFIAGLGFAWLITFGPLDFIRVGIHQRLDAVTASRPTASSEEVTGETAPKPPEDFSQPRPTAVPVPKASRPTQPKESAVQQPASEAPTQPSETEPSPDEIPQQTESSPVSPNVQQTPGVPVGYVASNSRFLSIRRAPGSSSADSDPDGTVRIGQLIYSPQALYPEQALRMHVDGIVKLQAIIGEDGTIRMVTSASGPTVLVAAATEAVREWRYEPTLIGKMPIESECEITFVFRQ